jgi:hypothetical protein
MDFNMYLLMMYYFAGILHGVAGLLIVGWALSHWMPGLFRAFGPTGVFPVVLAPGFIVMGSLLVGLRRGREKFNGEIQT